jgi:hypothetical protein
MRRIKADRYRVLECAVDARRFDIDPRPAIVYYFFVARGWGSPKPPDEG